MMERSQELPQYMFVKRPKQDLSNEKIRTKKTGAQNRNKKKDAMVVFSHIPEVYKECISTLTREKQLRKKMNTD